MIEENERLAVLVEKVEKDARNAAELLDKSERERKRLSEKNAQLTINGNLDVTLFVEIIKLHYMFLENEMSGYFYRSRV